jgi:hypothetical protein
LDSRHKNPNREAGVVIPDVSPRSSLGIRSSFGLVCVETGCVVFHKGSHLSKLLRNNEWLELKGVPPKISRPNYGGLNRCPSRGRYQTKSSKTSRCTVALIRPEILVGCPFDSPVFKPSKMMVGGKEPKKNGTYHSNSVLLALIFVNKHISL